MDPVNSQTPSDAAGETRAPAQTNIPSGSTPPPAKPTADDARHAGWFGRNAITLAMVSLCAAAGFYFLRRVDDPVATLITLSKVGLGLGLVIFIHELGHFLAAKLCDVHVETFSIGFGPPILGLFAFRRGETLYKIAWFPIGGYVKMLGEGSDDEGAEENPRSFKNKSVGQRMVIISAGVVMNLILAVICFIGVYMTHGVKQVPGVVGTVEPGGPAWEKDIQPGASIVQIGQRAKPYYEELLREVVKSQDQPLPLVYQTFENQKPVRHETMVVPRRLDKRPFPRIGIGSSSIPALAAKTQRLKAPYRPDTPAAAADPPIEFEDKIIGASDPDNPDQITALADDPRRPGSGQRDYFDLRRRMQQLIDKPIRLRVLRADKVTTEEITVAPAHAMSIGVRMQMGQIVAVRVNSPAAKAGIKVKEGDTSPGDVITAVEVTDAAGKPIRYSATRVNGELPLDPVKLPAQLAVWAAGKPKSWDVKLTVQREKNHTQVPTSLTLTWDNRCDLIDDPPTVPDSPLSLAGLGLAYRVRNVVQGVEPNSTAQGKLKDGDVIEAVKVTLQVSPTKNPTTEKEKLEDDQWAYYGANIQYEAVKEVGLKLKAGETEQWVTITPALDMDWPVVDRGFVFAQDVDLQKADGPVDAFNLAARRAVNQTMMIYESLISMVTGKQSARTISGPITIATVSFDIAGRDLFDFILFIALININLAVVNFLPIPILDGGHMVMLVYEWLRGKPPSDTVRFVSTLCGLAIILSLFALGIVNDLRNNF